MGIEWRRREMAGNTFCVVDGTVQWKASDTAIIIYDMWTDMACRSAAKRLARMAPRKNEVVSLARDHGVAIIHAPSGGMLHFEDTPLPGLEEAGSAIRATRTHSDVN